MDIDFAVENHGSIFLVHPNTSEARDHLVSHVDEEAQWFGRALAVEARYVGPLVERLLDEGFTVA